MVDIQLGSQGGDIQGRGSIALDLSTCLNRYGPVPAASEALRTMPEATIFRHPFGAAHRAESIFAGYFGVPESCLVAVRGASEGIANMARLLTGQHVGVPIPSYTEILTTFHDAERIAGRARWHTEQQLVSAAEAKKAVVFSNPQNPTGRFLEKADIERIAGMFPDCLFIVDASYDAFVDPSRGQCLIGCKATNVVVITSPTKFYGMGGVRVGVVWSRNQALLDGLRSLRTNWPLSSIEVTAVEAALRDKSWAGQVRNQLEEDGLWLHGWLKMQDDVHVTEGPLHFRLVEGKVAPLQKKLHTVGVAVRILSPAHGFTDPAMRISAPTLSERCILEDL